MLTASYDANNSANDMIWQESYAVLHFYHIDLRNAMMPLTSTDTDTGTNGITWPEDSVCDSLWSCGHKVCNGTIDNAISIMWCWCWCQWCHMTKRWCCTLFWSSWPNGAINKSLHHMVLMPVPMASYNQESHPAPHFYHLDLNNVMVLFMML